MFDTGHTTDQTQVNRSPVAAARQVLDEYWDGMTLPINPGKIAQDMGITLRVMAADSPHSGAIWYTEDGLPVIEYSRSEPLTRRRFTVAHEIGHFMLQHGKAWRDGPESFVAAEVRPIERAANQFAAELLMPADVVRNLVRSGTLSSVNDIAGVFGVSVAAMTYRILNLKLKIV